MNEFERKRVESLQRSKGLAAALEYYDNLKKNNEKEWDDDMLLTRPYRVVLDAIVDEYNSQEKKDDEEIFVKSDNFMKRIPNKKRNKQILNNYVNIILYLDHFGYFENTRRYIEAGKFEINPSTKALFYKNTYHRQVRSFIFRDIIIPLASAVIGALITLIISA